MMSTPKSRKNYSIIVPENYRLAEEKGLVSADWYMSPVPRQRLKELMMRKDGPAIRDTFIWFGALLAAGILAYFSWGTWWAIPAFLLYGIIYMTPAESRHHECAHGTPFKTSWMNEALYQVSSFMAIKPATSMRWRHTRHHTNTIIVGVDAEIRTPRPPVWRRFLLELWRLEVGPIQLKKVILHCFGKLITEEYLYIPKSEHRKTFWEARIWMMIYLAVIGWCMATGSILPAMYILLPILYGSWLYFFMGFSQHAGLHEDVLDHRLNSRTFLAHPVINFLYWNMNYHIEHHMFPMVPYFSLPALHEEIKHDCPAPVPSFRAAVKDTFESLWKQRKDPDYVIENPLPSTANPYWYGPQMKEAAHS